MDELPVIRESSINPESYLKSWWVQTVLQMASEKVEVWAICETCHMDFRVDVAALLKKVGPKYSLINRRSPCKLQPNCRGWNTFWFQERFSRGDVRIDVRMPLFDRKTYLRWLSDPEGWPTRTSGGVETTSSNNAQY